MKFYVLLHNIITMANANIMNSHHRWFEIEIIKLRLQLTQMVEDYWFDNKITDYQKDKLKALIAGITHTADE